MISLDILVTFKKNNKDYKKLYEKLINFNEKIRKTKITKI